MKRMDGFYPTDVRAVVALRGFLARRYPYLLGEWGPVLDACAGYGGLLEHLVDRGHRRAIERAPELFPELRTRVDNPIQGDGLDVALWPDDVALVALNPPHDTKTQTAFARVALEYRREWSNEVGVAVLGLGTWARSQTFQRELVDAFGRPDWTLGHTFRLSCDGSGRGDSRTHEWSLWLPASCAHRDPWTRLEVLPCPDVDDAALETHARLAACPPTGVAP